VDARLTGLETASAPPSGSTSEQPVVYKSFVQEPNSFAGSKPSKPNLTGGVWELYHLLLSCSFEHLADGIGAQLCAELAAPVIPQYTLQSAMTRHEALGLYMLQGADRTALQYMKTFGPNYPRCLLYYERSFMLVELFARQVNQRNATSRYTYGNSPWWSITGQSRGQRQSSAGNLWTDCVVLGKSKCSPGSGLTVFTSARGQ
jgi:hypothetical protein